jgi:hypothetical protein
MSVVTVYKIFGSGAEGSLIRHKRSSIRACPLDLLVAWLLDVGTGAEEVEVAVKVVAKLLLMLVVMILSLNIHSVFLRQGVKILPYRKIKLSLMHDGHSV